MNLCKSICEYLSPSGLEVFLPSILCVWVYFQLWGICLCHSLDKILQQHWLNGEVGSVKWFSSFCSSGPYKDLWSSLQSKSPRKNGQPPFSELLSHNNFPKGEGSFSCCFCYLWFWLTRTKILMLWKSVVMSQKELLFVCQLAQSATAFRDPNILRYRQTVWWFSRTVQSLLISDLERLVIVLCYCIYILHIYMYIYIHALQHVTIYCKGQYSFIFFYEQTSILKQWKWSVQWCE